MSRRAGVLLHPTSLPGPYGVGDLGPEARGFARWLGAAGQRIWQVLPLHPVGVTGSPYSSPSAFARNPLLLSPDDLLADGWLRAGELPPTVPHGRVDHPAVIASRGPMLALVADRVRAAVNLDALPTWAWQWARWAALAGVHGADWTLWPAGLRERDPEAIDDALAPLADEVARHLALQWAFGVQWNRLREVARGEGVELWGDVPIFVGHHSADVWAHPELFRLDSTYQPTVVSGCPPDAFTPMGQMWGHPLYDVSAHAEQGFSWWCDRIEALQGLVDCVRLDHFRGLSAMWEIAADAPDARGGYWVPGLGAGLLEALRARLGTIPLYAEDLGVITADVEALRDGFGLRGMAVLQFAWGPDPSHPYRPWNHRERQVVCTGTHDNDTTAGWFAAADQWTRQRVVEALGGDGSDAPWRMVQTAWGSRAEIAIVPLQDLLGLGSSARMNVPGEPLGNWGWRVAPGATDAALAARVRAEVQAVGR